jgi:hypothetical protein
MCRSIVAFMQFRIEKPRYTTLQFALSERCNHEVVNRIRGSVNQIIVGRQKRQRRHS